MANVYESKFKGVEIDDGVNIATYATGTGGINVTIKGTTNVTGTSGPHLEIDGSGVKITPVSGTGTSTTDVMSQKAVTDELGKKQDTITNQTSLNVGSLKMYTDGGATGTYAQPGRIEISGTPASILIRDIRDDYGTTIKPYTDPMIGAYLTSPVTVSLPYKSGTLATTDDIPAAGVEVYEISSSGGRIIGDAPIIQFDYNTYNHATIVSDPGIADNRKRLIIPTPVTKTINNTSILGTGNISLATTADITSAITGKQDKLTTSSEISIKKLQVTTIGAQDNGSLTIVDPLTVSNDVYVNELAATKGVFSSGAIVQGTLTADGIDSTAVTVADYANAPHNLSQLEGDRLSFYYGADPYDGNICNLLAPAGNVTGSATYNIKLPQKSGTVALLSDITGGGSAGVSSIGGKTGAITLGDGLTMSGQQLVNKVKVYTSGNYLCIDTN